MTPQGRAKAHALPVYRRRPLGVNTGGIVLGAPCDVGGAWWKPLATITRYDAQDFVADEASSESRSRHGAERSPPIDAQPILAHDGVLRVRKCPVRFSLPDVAEEILGLLRVIEIRAGRQVTRHRPPFVARRPPTGKRG